MPQTSQKIRRKIIKLELQNYSTCQISKITNIHKATVSRVILRFKECGSLERQKSPGRPKKITEKVERIVVRDSKKDPFLNATQLQKISSFDIAKSTIRKILVKYGLRSRLCAKKSKISEPNRRKRRDWAKKCFQKKMQIFGKLWCFLTKPCWN